MTSAFISTIKLFGSKFCSNEIACAFSTRKLEHIGTLQPLQNKPKYKTGQMFLHKVFAYRGVILFPWTVNVYERKPEIRTPQENDVRNLLKNAVPDIRTYYQVLMDTRDTSSIAMQTEAVTFLSAADLGMGNTNVLYTIPGIDYVAHEDIIPYTSVENAPLQHKLFETFLKRGANEELYATESFNNWQSTNHTCLELSKVYLETTKNIQVTAIPFFLGFKKSRKSQPAEYWWRYCIRVENLGEASVQLQERNWRIFSNGSVQAVKGRGVVGREPVLDSNQPAFQYSSHVSLRSPNGHMWGTFCFEKEDGEQFDIRIPSFILESKSLKSCDLNNDV
uniref:Polymerase delta-interacting protein 2-like n=1 Tax=Phallusia mammillata TaxID=59560 RepID=A0A6F9DPU3_9ASCI|nr:polymerase delta-interacting protein 2-like [Phallusia mammillata]